MKSTNKKEFNIDAMAAARKNKKFQQFSKDAASRIKIAVEIYDTRNTKGLSQQELAKRLDHVKACEGDE